MRERESIYFEIILAVEPFDLDEGRSLYKVEYSVAAKIIRIYLCLCLYMYVFVVVELNLSP